VRLGATWGGLDRAAPPLAQSCRPGPQTGMGPHAGAVRRGRVEVKILGFDSLPATCETTEALVKLTHNGVEFGGALETRRYRALLAVPTDLRFALGVWPVLGSTLVLDLPGVGHADLPLASLSAPEYRFRGALRLAAANGEWAGDARVSLSVELVPDDPGCDGGFSVPVDVALTNFQEEVEVSLLGRSFISFGFKVSRIEARVGDGRPFHAFTTRFSLALEQHELLVDSGFVRRHSIGGSSAPDALEAAFPRKTVTKLSLPAHREELTARGQSLRAYYELLLRIPGAFVRAVQLRTL
jgi:hypothetical protein